MNISAEMLIQVATALISAGGVLWRLSDRLKQLELDRQADSARLEQQIADMRRSLDAHTARSDERHLGHTRRLDEHAAELTNNRSAHASMRQSLDEHGRQLARLGA
jgi:hypothetical protein